MACVRRWITDNGASLSYKESAKAKHQVSVIPDPRCLIGLDRRGRMASLSPCEQTTLFYPSKNFRPHR